MERTIAKAFSARLPRHTARSRIASSFLRRTTVAMAVAIALVLAGATAWAQTISSTVLGTVTDPSGNVVVGAAVTLINEGTGDQRTGKTDATGGFSFPSILPGTYAVTVENAGFQKYEEEQPG